MNKLNDNELLSVWNESKNKICNTKNEYFHKHNNHLVDYVCLI